MSTGLRPATRRPSSHDWKSERCQPSPLGMVCSIVCNADQLMLTDLVTGCGGPSYGGMWAPRKAAAMHAPPEVPANGGPSTDADTTLPLGEKVTRTRAVPVGPSSFLQPRAVPPAAPS